MAMTSKLQKPLRPEGPSQTLAKGLQVLDLLTQADDGLRLTDVASVLELNLNTVSRLLTTLESSGFASRNEKGRYEPGAKLVSATVQKLSIPSLINIARPYLVSLRDATSETSYIVVRTGNSMVLLDVVDGTHDIRLVLQKGAEFPLLPAPTGLVLTSELPVEDVVSLSERIGVPERLVTEEKVKDSRHQLQHSGYILDHMSLASAGTCTIAMPVKRSGHVVASLGIAGPSQRFDERVGSIHSRLFREIAAQLSTAISND